MEIKLTPKQAKFVEEYLVDMNGAAAAIRAGYAEKTAYRTAYENLRKPQIQSTLAKHQKALQKKVKVDQHRILLELACLAFSNIADIYDENGQILPIKEMPEQTQRAIIYFKETSRETSSSDGGVEVTTMREYKFGNKDAALDKLAKHLGLYNEGGDKQQAGRVKMIFNLGGAEEE